MGELLYIMKDYTRALSYLKEAIELDKTKEDPYTLRAYIYYTLK